MNCDQFKKQIDSFLDGELTINESLHMKKHLSSCRNCCLEFRSYDKSVKLMRKIFNDTDPPDRIRKKVFQECNCAGPGDLTNSPNRKK